MPTFDLDEVTVEPKEDLDYNAEILGIATAKGGTPKFPVDAGALAKLGPNVVLLALVVEDRKVTRTRTTKKGEVTSTDFALIVKPTVLRFAGKVVRMFGKAVIFSVYGKLAK